MSSTNCRRPDPDELLRRLAAADTQERRGRLKIFLGYAPRVGKSLRMFDEGRRRLERGQDVIVGAVQVKGAAQLTGHLSRMEVIGGAGLDIEAILKRKPQVCLIDELAFENPPESRHPHRWQDVLELLEHGIQVVTALNLQHIAEQQDAVERITGKRAASAVPESFIRMADEIVVVDVPTDEVSYAGLYTPEQLSELRELALLLAAEVVESQLQRYLDLHGIRQSWGTQERILVCVTPRSNVRPMIESGRRNADRFHGQLLVVYVEQDDLSRELQEMVDGNLEYAQKLGADVHRLHGADPIREIIEFAHAQRITQIFVGHSQRSRWKFWSPNPLDRLIDGAEGIDVRIFPHTQQAA